MTRKEWIERMPFKRKLAMLMIVVMTASFGASAIITGIYSYRANRKAVEHHLDVLASAIGDNCSAALVFDDETAAGEVLSALGSDNAITGATLTDERAVVVATIGHAGPREGDAPPASSLFGARLRVDRRITVDGKTVGYLTIWAETSAITTRLATIGIIGLTSFLVSVLVILFVFERMQRVVVAPLVDLHDIVRRVVRTRDYSIRAPRVADDEINDVAMAINDLLAQFEAQVPPPPPAETPTPAPKVDMRVPTSRR